MDPKRYRELVHAWATKQAAEAPTKRTAAEWREDARRGLLLLAHSRGRELVAAIPEPPR